MAKIIVCYVCGGQQELRYQEYINQKLEAFRLCHRCDFWLEKIHWGEWHSSQFERVVRISGRHYMLPSGEPTPEELTSTGGWGFGHSGREFRIKFKDGREVSTRSLMCQGDIPERFRHILTDNAEFVK